MWTNSAALFTYVSAFGVSVALPVDSRNMRRRSCRGDSDGGAGGGRSVMATSGIFEFLLFSLDYGRSAAGGGAAQISRLRAALRFFWFSLAARRVPSVLASLRRVKPKLCAAVGFGF